MHRFRASLAGSTRILPLLLLCVLGAAGPAPAETAAGLPRTELTGGGPANDDCSSSLDVVGIDTSPRARTVTCVDGDPLCDRDHLVNGRCELWIRLCVNHAEAAGCRAQSVTALTVTDASEALFKLGRSLDALPLPVADASCAPLTTLIVPLGTRANGSARKGRQTVAWEATGTDSVDRDGVTIVCKPPAKEHRGSGLSFRTLERKIFARQCAFSGCHGTNNPQAGLVLVGDAAYDALVNKLANTSAAQFSGKKLVVPSAPETSFLIDKLEGKLGPGEGAAMPLGRAPLATNELTAIRAWIRAAAPRRGPIPGGLAGIGDKQPRIPAPAVPPDGLQVHMDPVPLGAVRETEGCQMVRLGNPEDIAVRGWELLMHEGSHHFILRAFRCEDDDHDGVNDCDELDFDARFPTGFRPCEEFGSNWGFLVGSQTPHFLVDYQTPETGVAVQLHANQPLLLNAHYTNPYRDTLAEVWVNVTPADPLTVRHPARILFETLANAFIKVPPGNVRSVSADTCAFADSALCGLAGEGAPAAEWFALLGMTSHMHKRSVKFVTDLHDGGGTPISRGADDMTDADDGSPHLYVSTDYSDPINLAFWPPITVQRGQRLTYSCREDNGVDTPVRFGCELTAAVAPGVSAAEQILAGRPLLGGHAKPCVTDADCAGVGTGRCVPANLTLGELADDEMCILPGLYYPCSGDAASCLE